MNYELFQAINQYAGRVPWLDNALILIGENLLYVMALSLLVLWFLSYGHTQRENRRTVICALLTAAFSYGIAQLISALYDHPRPFVTYEVHQLVAHAADSSFPSDHAILSFALAWAVLFRNRAWGWVLLAGAVLTGLSRIYFGVHYPADILGGAGVSLVVGAIVAFIGSRLFRPIRRRPSRDITNRF
jgi:undecaprenyl-diphosphatase